MMRKNLLGRLWALFASIVLLISSAGAQTCYTANGETSTEPPAGWVMSPTFSVSTTTPLAGAKSYVSRGFRVGTAYNILSPVFYSVLDYTNFASVEFRYRVSQTYVVTSSAYTVVLKVQNISDGTTVELKRVTGTAPARPDCLYLGNIAVCRPDSETNVRTDHITGPKPS